MELLTSPDDSVQFWKILGGGRRENLMRKSSRNIPWDMELQTYLDDSDNHFQGDELCYNFLWCYMLFSQRCIGD